MKFEDILFIVETGLSIGAAASGNPLLVASVDAGTRLIKIGQDAYSSGQQRSEWTPEQEAKFDNEVFPKITKQAHWINPAEPTTGEAVKA